MCTEKDGGDVTMHEEETPGMSIKKRVMDFGASVAKCIWSFSMLLRHQSYIHVRVISHISRASLCLPVWVLCFQGVQLSNMDHFWRKIRKVLTSISFKVVLPNPKSPGGNGGRGGGRGGADGLLKLRDDVKMCGYRDVEVMWNMLSRNQQTQQMELAKEGRKASATKTRPPKRPSSSSSSKQRAIWRLFFWTNNHNSPKC